MTITSPSSRREPLILRGIHLDLTAAMRMALENNAARLFRHEPRIDRVRVDVARGLRGRIRMFTAKGRIEIAGPDLCASVTDADAYKAINLLIEKLDRMLRRRTTAGRRHRAADDIRLHAGSLSPA